MSYNGLFEDCLKYLLKIEGGYVNDKDDWGGATNFGITQRTYDNWNKRYGKPIKDVKEITKEEAKEIYHNDYWIPSGADEMEDAGMAYAVFDTEVIAGHGTNILIKSRTKNKNDLNEYLKVRGEFHNEKVAESKKDTNPNKKDQTKYADGWSNRLELIKKTAKTLRCKDVQKNLDKFPIKYTGKNDIGSISKEEFIKNEKDINKEIEKRRNFLRKKGLFKSQNSFFVDFDKITLNGKKWADLDKESRKSFIEGFDNNAFTDEGIKRAKLQEKIWTTESVLKGKAMSFDRKHYAKKSQMMDIG